MRRAFAAITLSAMIAGGGLTTVWADDQTSDLPSDESVVVANTMGDPTDETMVTVDPSGLTDQVQAQGGDDDHDNGGQPSDESQ